MKKWINFVAENGYVHTCPMDDLITHTLEDCVCGPEEIPVKRDDGSVNWQIAHHALDGRE